MKFKNLKVNIKLPYVGSVEGTWEPNENERKAAWEMYVELVTRISVNELKDNEGLLREALNSLYSLFDTTRYILKKYGPDVAVNNEGADDKISFGILAVTILNTTLRPLLSKWHPLLLDYEIKKQKSISALEHEKNWSRNNELRAEINGVREILIQYADLLGGVAGVPSLIIDRN